MQKANKVVAFSFNKITVISLSCFILVLMSISQQNFSIQLNYYKTTKQSVVSSSESLLLQLLNNIPDKMYGPSTIDLIPEEIMTIPVWKKNNNTLSEELVSGGKCHYPTLSNNQGIPPGRCCIGSTSSGGFQKYVGVNKGTCRQDIHTYNRTRDLALKELDKYPICIDKNNNNNSTRTTCSTSSSSSSISLKCDICQIINIASTMKHHRISFAGDSVQHQMFIGFECELHRRGFNFTSSWQRKKWERDKTKIPPKRVVWKYGIGEQTCFNVTVPQWMMMMTMMPSTNNNGNEVVKKRSNHVEICFFYHYRPYMDMEQHKIIASYSDVLIINYGLHYLPNDKNDILKEFNLTLESLLHTFKNINFNINNNNNNNYENETSSTTATSSLSSSIPGTGETGTEGTKNGCHLIYRETSAQHFNDIGGEFFGKVKKYDKCVPINPMNNIYSYDNNKYSWRRKMFNEAAKKQNYTIIDPYGNRISDDDDDKDYIDNDNENVNNDSKMMMTKNKKKKYEVTLLPLYNFTSLLYDLHPSGDECTHFCYTPYIWYPSWRHLRITMDRLAFDDMPNH